MPTRSIKILKKTFENLDISLGKMSIIDSKINFYWIETKYKWSIS